MHNGSKNCGDSEKLFLTAEVNQILFTPGHSKSETWLPRRRLDICNLLPVASHLSSLLLSLCSITQVHFYITFVSHLI